MIKRFNFKKKKGRAEETPQQKEVRVVKEASDKKKKKEGDKLSRSLLFVNFSIKDQTLFAKRLAFLTNAGVTLHESMVILHEQCRSKGKARVYQVIINDISSGKFLHVSLKRFRRFFGDFAINIIKVGEMSGGLTSNLNYLADELRKKQLLKQKIIGALIYPIFITVVTLVLVGMLTVFIFPKIMPIFQSLNVELPFTTLVLLAISNFLKAYSLYLIGAIVLFIIAFIASYKKIRPFRIAVDMFLIRAPFIGRLTRAYYMANFNRTLGLLLRSGIGIIEALSIVGDTVENHIYKKHCKMLSEAVTRGERISKHLKANRKLFPDMVGHMIAIGEKSGKLSETLIYLAEYYENEVDDITKNLSSAIEPVLMVFMGVLVGFVAVSVIMPIYAITQNLSR